MFTLIILGNIILGYRPRTIKRTYTYLERW